MNWKTIRLELSKADGFPHGSAGRAYLIRVPLDEDGAIDAAAVERNPSQAPVRRFWASVPEQEGRVEGANDGWAFRMRGNGETIHRLGPEPLRLYHQISIANSHGERLLFRVSSIRSLGSRASAAA